MQETGLRIRKGEVIPAKVVLVICTEHVLPYVAYVGKQAVEQQCSTVNIALWADDSQLAAASFCSVRVINANCKKKYGSFFADKLMFSLFLKTRARSTPKLVSASCTNQVVIEYAAPVTPVAGKKRNSVISGLLFCLMWR